MELRKKILDEAHTSMFTMHPGSNKMYQDLKQKFWWTRMKREIANYVSECDVCQRVKADQPAGMHQPLAIPAWKWEDWVCLAPKRAMTLFGSLSIVLPNPLTSCLSKLITLRLLMLSSTYAAVHDVFHVSQLKKCLRVPKEVIDTSQIQIEPDLTYEEHPIKILDQKQRSTRRRTINFYKVQWNNHSEEEATWEQEEFLRTRYPDFLPSTSN
ncbi:hypothetical protein U9M48_034439 [Paspalum notatum var. saurae]|uniref:Uncharacterized protein n=1 Tax=Paspalum notatum var. saurae TaxID=547442 RepID=A0AAQ3UC81_PASNO